MPTAYVSSDLCNMDFEELNQFQQEMGYTTPSSLEKAADKGEIKLFPFLHL